MTLFGRDSLLTSWMLLPIDLSLVAGTLHVLADLQGSADEPDDRGTARPHPARGAVRARRGSRPGRRVGVLRHGRRDAPVRHAGRAGPPVGPARRRRPMRCCCRRPRRSTGSSASAIGTVTAMWSTSAPPTVAWSIRAGRTPSTPSTIADGTLAEPPIALAEVQGYVYAAYRARARLAGVFRRPRRRRRAIGAGCCPASPLQRGLLAAGPRLLRAGAGPGQAPRRVVGIEPGPRPVDRHRRPGEGGVGRPVADRTGDVHRVAASARWPTPWARTTR